MDEMQMHLDRLSEVYERIDGKVKEADRENWYRTYFVVEDLDDIRSSLAQTLLYMKKLQTRM